MSYDWPEQGCLCCPSCDDFLSEPESCADCASPATIAVAWQVRAAKSSTAARDADWVHRSRSVYVYLQEQACRDYAKARRAYDQFMAPLECELCGCEVEVCECLPADRAGLAAVAADLERRAKANVGSTRGEIQSRLADRARRAYDQLEGRP